MREPNKKDGQCCFHSTGLFKVKWEYNDHVIVCILKHEDSFFYPQANLDECTLMVFYEDINVTDKFVEPLNDLKVEHVRTTLDNIRSIMYLIDENYTNFIQEYEERGGEENGNHEED